VLVVTVRDNGMGIPPDKLADVFEMFSQIENSLDRSQGGLGIGLTLVKRLVELHGGTVEAHSEGLGQGSEFRVRLPILVEPANSASEIKPPPNLDSLQPRRILIVDDNLDAARTLSMLLKIGGNETCLAHDGLDAVEQAERFRPEIVLLDIGLPKLNGFDTCRRIREQPGGTEMLLVALTGWGQEEDRRKSKEAGFNAHLIKPVDLPALFKILADHDAMASTPFSKSKNSA
jgi:CheY-like chemotaxis protein